MKALPLLLLMALATINLPAYADWEPQPPGIDSPNFLVYGRKNTYALYDTETGTAEIKNV